MQAWHNRNFNYCSHSWYAVAFDDNRDPKRLVINSIILEDIAFTDRISEFTELLTGFAVLQLL